MAVSDPEKYAERTISTKTAPNNEPSVGSSKDGPPCDFRKDVVRGIAFSVKQGKTLFGSAAQDDFEYEFAAEVAQGQQNKASKGPAGCDGPPPSHLVSAP